MNFTKKRIFSLATLPLLVLSLSVSAAEPRAVTAYPSLSFNGTTAVCTANCKSMNSNDQLDVTLTLYQGSTYVNSWSDSGNKSVSLSGQCTVKRGKDYKLVLSYSVNGQSMPAASTTGTCP